MRKAYWRRPGCCLAALLVLAGCQSDATLSSNAMGVAILNQMRGNDPALRDPAVKLINSQEELTALASEALSKLTVDFHAQSLLIVALGQKPTGGYWVRIDAVQRQGADLYLQGVANAPGNDQMTTMMLTYPFAAAVIPKQQDVQTLHPEVESVQGRKAE